MPSTRDRIRAILARTQEPRWSVLAIARETGVPQPTLHRWLTGGQRTIRSEAHMQALEEFAKREGRRR